jgi:hypothetical protein
MTKRKKTASDNWSHKNDFPIEEVWNTDNTIAQLIVPRLQAFKALDKHKTPLIIPHYKEISGRKIEDGFYTTFAIRR